MPPSTQLPIKVYFAGPDVFRPDVRAWAESVRALCVARGAVALLPVDGEETSAPRIYQANVSLLNAADAVLANLNPFRGQEPDSGTCVEVGMALALGKPVVGYLADARPLAERLGAEGREGTPRDAAGWSVENFGLPLNLMLAVPVRLVAGGVGDALDALVTN